MSAKEKQVTPETTASVTPESAGTGVKKDPWKEMRTVRIPKLVGKHQPDVVVSVNGRNFSVKRGVEVEVPLPVYEVLMNSFTAEDKANEYYYGKANVPDVD